MYLVSVPLWYSLYETWYGFFPFGLLIVTRLNRHLSWRFETFTRIQVFTCFSTSIPYQFIAMKTSCFFGSIRTVMPIEIDPYWWEWFRFLIGRCIEVGHDEVCDERNQTSSTVSDRKRIETTLGQARAIEGKRIYTRTGEREACVDPYFSSPAFPISSLCHKKPLAARRGRNNGGVRLSDCSLGGVRSQFLVFTPGIILW